MTKGEEIAKKYWGQTNFGDQLDAEAYLIRIINEEFDKLNKRLEAMEKPRPYDCYWSRLVLAYEKLLPFVGHRTWCELQQGKCTCGLGAFKDQLEKTK